MIIIWGSKFYGKTDEVPGLFHVATQFGHLWYIPLFPMGSHLVLEERDSLWRGIGIPLSLKSVLLGWGRPGSVIAAVVAAIRALNERRDPDAGIIAACVCAAAIVVFLVIKFSRGLRFATYERARALAEVAGLNEKGKILIDLHFGMVSEAQAREKLLKAEAEDLAAAEREIAARKAALEARQAGEGRQA
jgi:hypothetical protein